MVGEEDQGTTTDWRRLKETSRLNAMWFPGQKPRMEKDVSGKLRQSR